MDAKYLVALSLLGCAPASSSKPEPKVEEVAVAPLAPHVLATLRAAAVTHDNFARRVLYTWTSDVGIARMRKERRLLLPTEKEGYFVQQIDALAAGAGTFAEVARVLAEHPSFSARRYAWPRPFATRIPLSDRAYGDHLVSVVLKPNAVLARFDVREEVPFRFFDLDGEEVPLGRVLADPSTLAAVYHAGTHPESGAPFREYVLVNESMIAEWSLGTRAIAAVLDEDLRAVRALAGAPLDLEQAGDKWETLGARAEDLYAASLAFDTPRHRPTRANLKTLATLMTEVAHDDPELVVAPAVPFTSLSATPPKLPPLPRKFGVKPRKYECS